MKPATRLTEVVPGLHRWSSFHPQWKVDFSSYAIQTEDGVVYVDPIRPGPTVQKKLAELGDPLGVFLTSSNHERDADWFRKEYEVQVYAHEKAKPDCDGNVDVLVLDREKLPGGLRVIYLPGGGAGECALFSSAAGGAVMVGDSLVNGKGGLAFLPDQYCEDSKQSQKSLRKLLDFNFKTITFAHGAPLVGNAKQQVAALFTTSRKKKE
jgi:glyoxylase-like metal-dependent hydrolase (beta-lactamase superfamily II)